MVRIRIYGRKTTDKARSTGLYLVRFVTASFEPKLKEPHFEIDTGDVVVRAMAAVTEENDKGLTTIIEARTELEEWPTRIPGGTILIPKKVRNKLEEHIEYALNLITVSDSAKHSITSPSPAVAFVAKTKEAKEWLDASSCFKEQEIVVMDVAPNIAPLDTELLNKIGDRLDGVSLLASAISQGSALGEFRDFIRLFERAFKKPSGMLGQILVDTLHPRFGYKLNEVEEWLDLRDKAIHADVKAANKLAYDKDVAKHTGRMKQAAYDLLMNKENWQQSDTVRLERWVPIAGTTSNRGDLFITKGEAASIPIIIFDGFGSYPISGKNLIPIIAQLNEEYFIKRLAQDIRKQGEFTILANPEESNRSGG